MKKTRSGPPGSKGNPKRPSSSSAAPPQQQQGRIALLDSLDDLSDARVRLEACAAIAIKFEPLEEANKELEAKMRKEMVKLGREGMFKSLVRNAMDKDGVVALNAIGALRNLALTGGDKAMSLMQQEDAWTALGKVVSDPITHANSVSAEARGALEAALRKEALSVMGLMCEWSASVAERRLPDSLGILVACFQNPNKDVVEAAAKLLYKASEANTSLAKALVSTDAGKQMGMTLETLVSNLSTVPGESLVASAYGLGVLLNVAMCFEHQDLPGMIAKWFASAGNVLSEACLPSVTLSDAIVQDAKLFEEDDMLEEDGRNKTESALLKQWLDVVEAQSLVFEAFTSMLRKVAMEREEASPAKAAFWAQVTQPLEVAGLLASALTYGCAPFPLETNGGPSTLCLPVIKLQQTASECASAAIDAFSSIDPGFVRGAWTRMIRVLTETWLHGLSRSEADDRLSAYGQVVSSLARRETIPMANAEETEAIVQLMKGCRVEAVRALMCSTLSKASQLNLGAMLQPVARSLIEAMAEEKSLVVLSEQADALMDLFSEENRQSVFDSLEGTKVFGEFSKQFDRRLNELRRQEDSELEESDFERLMEVKANVDEFLKWKKSIK